MQPEHSEEGIVTLIKYISATLALLVLSACTLHKVEAPSVPDFVPDGFSQVGELPIPDNWWYQFEDPILNELMAQTAAENRSLQAAWARLDAALASARIAGASLLPQVNGTASVGRSKQSFFGQSATSNNYSLGFEASYEVDVWRKLSARKAAALAEVQATEEDAQALAIMLSATTASTYFAAMEQKLQLELLEEQEAVNEQFLEIIEARFSNGSASAVEVYQQREQLAAVQSQVPVAKQRLALSQNLLATLTGRAPVLDVLTEVRPLPEVAGLPATGLPMELLERRPDVRAARARITAQDYRLGAAIADRYPSFRLATTGGFSAASSSDLFSEWVWSLAGSVLGPIFDGGRRKAEVDRNAAVLKQLVANYEETVLTSLREVENALDADGEQRELLSRLMRQQDLAEAAYRAGRSRYLEGVGNFLTVLTGLQAYQRAQRNVLTARYNLINNRIALYQALGAYPSAPAPQASSVSGETP